MISTYFSLGLTHILDFEGYDHMLFLMLLIAGIKIKQWKNLLGLITAFTIGHSITLAIVTLNSPLLNSNVVEFFIPITILLTGIYNLVFKSTSIIIKLSLTLIFGLIHGMGFATYLSALLPQTESLWKPLLYFNLGVEAGQIVFASAFIGLLSIWQFVSKNTVQKIQNVISAVGIAISLFLALSNWPFL